MSPIHSESGCAGQRAFEILWQAHVLAIIEIESKTILNKHKKIDSWFLARYGMNIYRGCTHDCAYCDGRAEGYYVDGEFGRDISVKVNASALPGGHNAPILPPLVIIRNDGMSVMIGSTPQAKASSTAMPLPSLWLP